MHRMMSVSIEDGRHAKLLFEFHGCGESSPDTGCPSLPNLMKPLIGRSRDQILAQWRAHRPERSVHPANHEVALEDISVGLAFDVITSNDRTPLAEESPAPIVSVTGYCAKPWSVNVRGRDTCTRHANNCGGRHLGARLIFDLSYISKTGKPRGKVSPVWKETFDDLWGNEAQQRACAACAVYEEAVLDEEIVPRMDSPATSHGTSSDSS